MGWISGSCCVYQDGEAPPSLRGFSLLPPRGAHGGNSGLSSLRHADPSRVRHPRPRPSLGPLQQRLLRYRRGPEGKADAGIRRERGARGPAGLRPRARTIALLLIAVSFVVGIRAYFTVLPTPFLPALLVLGNGIGWFYSAPPVRLSSRGLGEAATATAIGLLIPGMGYLAIAGSLDLTFLLAALPLLLYGVAFILSVEIPDREADALSGKRTFIVRNGVPAGMRLALAATFLATVLYSTALLTGIVPPAVPVVVFALVSLVPFAIPCRRTSENHGVKGTSPPSRSDTVLSLIAFAILTDASLLIAILGR